MKRIVVLGCAGTGKTLFARRLGAAIGAPVVCLDAVWRREWTADDVPEFRRLMAAAHAGEVWVSDGNFAQATFDLRLPRADLIVWLERPRAVCLWRAFTRVFRPDEAHRLRDLPQVSRFVWNFDRINRPKIETLREQFGAGVLVVRLGSDAEVEGFLSRTVGAADTE